MAISLSQLNRTNVPKPPRILIHGVAGVGKTTFASESRSPVFVQTEDGLGTLAATSFPLARTFEEVMGALAALYTEEHDHGTVVIDSVDWLEPLIWNKACRDNGWNSIEDPGYGRGYIAALALWRQYIDGLNALRDERGMTVVQIAHTDIKRFDSTEHDPYDRYVIKLHTRAAALLQEHSDVVLFANYRISTVKAEVGFNKKVSFVEGVLKTYARNARTHSDAQVAQIAASIAEFGFTNLQGQYKLVEQTYGQDVLNLVLAKGYLTKLLANKPVVRYLKQKQPELLTEFEAIVQAASLDH